MSPFAQWVFLAVVCHCVKKTPYRAMAFPFRIAIGAETTSPSQGCAFLSRWSGLQNRLYLVYCLFGFHSAQIVHAKFILFPEDVLHQTLYTR